MKIQKITDLIVKYNGQLVGYLHELKNETIAFQYDDSWIKNGFSISPLSLPLTKDVFVCEKNTFEGLYGVFADSLPDGWGELLMLRMLKKQAINYDNLSPLQKLALIKDNGLGALSYEPNLNTVSEHNLYNLDSLSAKIQAILKDEYKTDNLDEIYNLGGSSGGARPKAHIEIDNEEWIVKFPCLIDPPDIGYKEYQANSLAKKCGIDVNEHKLFTSSLCKGYFGAKRFDRDNNKKVHMISLCALLETTHRIPNLDYGHLFKVIDRICIDREDKYEAFRRMCFNVYYDNKDDHGKNFSFIYDEKLHGYKLSPFYDITKTPIKAEHEMTINYNGLPTDSDILALANDCDLSLSRCKKILTDIKNIIQNS